MLTEKELTALESERKYFIEDRRHASYSQWLSSKGTNFTCYVEYMNSLNHEQKLDNTIDQVRVFIYVLNKPIEFVFFYWTILLFIIHKFNFNKPVMKIILWHFIIRCLGNVIDKFGDIHWMKHYYSNVITTDSDGNVSYSCRYDASSAEMHPFRWMLTRQIATFFWYMGEIIADWYPLFRTNAISKNRRDIWYVYASCGLFNLSKIIVVAFHFTLSPMELYDEQGVYKVSRINKFYFTYWMLQLIVIYSSVAYDFSVYIALKKNIFQRTALKDGFLKNFKSISEYRILVTAFISVIFLPLVSLSIIFKYYYYYKYGYENLNFSFEDIRNSITNLPYYMIFIDQILLILSRNGDGSYMSKSDTSSKYDNKNNQMKITYNRKSTFASSTSGRTINNTSLRVMKNNDFSIMTDDTAFTNNTNNQNTLLDQSIIQNDSILNISTDQYNTKNLEPLYSPSRSVTTSYDPYGNTSLLTELSISNRKRNNQFFSNNNRNDNRNNISNINNEWNNY